MARDPRRLLYAPSPRPPRVTSPRADAIVLAAGASTRLGYPKSLAHVGAERALPRVLRVLRDAGIARPIVVLGAHADIIRKGADLGDARVVVNEDWERGRTSTLKVGLLALRASDPGPTGRLVIAPVDRPMFLAADVRALVDAPSAIALPLFEGRRGHPVVVSRSLDVELASLRDDEPLSVVIRRDPARVVDVPVTHPGVLFNLDTPENAVVAAAYADPPEEPA